MQSQGSNRSSKPTEAIFWGNLGKANYERGDYKGAEAAYEKAAFYDPIASRYWIFHGNAKTYANRFCFVPDNFQA